MGRREPHILPLAIKGNIEKDTVKANVTAQFPLREVLGDVEPDFGRKFGHDREALRRYSSVGHWQVCRPSTTRAMGERCRQVGTWDTCFVCVNG